jgi:hypothetical protein
LKIFSLYWSKDKFDADTITQTLQPPCQSIHKLVTAPVVEVVWTQLLIRFVAGQPMERTHDNRVGDGHDGSFLAPAGSQVLIEGRQIGALAIRRRGEPCYARASCRNQ